MQKKLSTMLASAAIFSTTMVGCTSVGADQRSAAFIQSAPSVEQKVENALADKDFAHALISAEELAAAEPNNAAYRSLLGRAYLANGRYVSARTAFTDAMTLGNRDVRTIVSLALSEIGLGNAEGAHELLLAQIDNLPAADYGLAMALTGDAQEGVRALIEAVRSPDATAKTRQNLAYALALGGVWGQARLVAGQDLTAKEAERRIGEWSQVATTSTPAQRVAALTGVAPRSDDAGMPVRLALKSSAPIQVAAALADFAAQAEQALEPASPTAERMEVVTSTERVRPEHLTAALADTVAASAEAPLQLIRVAPARLPAPAPLAEAEPVVPERMAAAVDAPDVLSVAAAFDTMRTPEAPLHASSGNVAEDSIREAARASFQRASVADTETLAGRAEMSRLPRQPVTTSPYVRAMTFAPMPDAKASDWVIQLGAFNSAAVAKEKWRAMSKSGAPLSRFAQVYSQLTIRGRVFHRVAVRGFADRASANALCKTLSAEGQACFVRTDESGQTRVARAQALAKPVVTASRKPAAVGGNMQVAARR